MKKLVSIIALLALVLIASSGYNESQSILSVGDKAPQISVSNPYESFDLGRYRGQYVLLTFWSCADAQSRVDCNRYSSWSEGDLNKAVKHVAINFDNQPALFNEVVRLDNLEKEAQFNVNGIEAANIRTSFGLNEGYGSVLISPDGRIISFNPSLRDLSSLV